MRNIWQSVLAIQAASLASSQCFTDTEARDWTQIDTANEPSKRRGCGTEGGWALPLTPELQSDLSLRVMSHSTSRLRFLFPDHRREVPCMCTVNRAAAVSEPSVCEARWCQYKAALSASGFTGRCACLVGSSSIELYRSCFSFFFFFLSQYTCVFLLLSPFHSCTRQLPRSFARSLSATHIRCSLKFSRTACFPREAGTLAAWLSNEK